MARAVRHGWSGDPPGERLGADEVWAGSAAAVAIGLVMALFCAGSMVAGLIHLADDPWGRLAMLPFQALIVYGLTWFALRDVRHAAWLDGTVLYVRGPFLIRCCDLATAHVLRIGSSAGSRVAGPIPTLVARKDDDGRSVRYRLVATSGQWLSYEDRVRIADVIEAHAPAPAAGEIAAELRKRWVIDIGKKFPV